MSNAFSIDYNHTFFIHFWTNKNIMLMSGL